MSHEPGSHDDPFDNLIDPFMHPELYDSIALAHIGYRGLAAFNRNCPPGTPGWFIGCGCLQWGPFVRDELDDALEIHAEHVQEIRDGGGA